MACELRRYGVTDSGLNYHSNLNPISAQIPSMLHNADDAPRHNHRRAKEVTQALNQSVMRFKLP
ncbi:MAG: hypothetical protein P8X89_09510 [Reinekea sp.]|jgi:hypothetical protein